MLPFMLIKSSTTHPLYVVTIADDLPGRVSLTMAPGKTGDAAFAGGFWRRDLQTDLDRLVDVEMATTLVCLLEDHELTLLGIPDLVERASRRLRVLRLPIPDGGVLPTVAPVEALVRTIDDATRAGEHVVIHCRGGLGRAGTIGGCVLRHQGLSLDETFARLRRRHVTSCPETSAQREFIRAFRP